MEVVAGEYDQLVRRCIAYLIAEQPQIAHAITTVRYKNDWRVNRGRAREEAAVLCPQRLAQSKRMALGLALLAIGENNECVRVLAIETWGDHPSSGFGSCR